MLQASNLTVCLTLLFLSVHMQQEYATDMVHKELCHYRSCWKICLVCTNQNMFGKYKSALEMFSELDKPKARYYCDHWNSIYQLLS